MGFPNAAGKHGFDAMVTPEAALARLKKHGRLPDGPPPRAAVLCYSRRLLREVTSAEQTQSYKWPSGGAVHLLDRTGGKVAVVGDFGIGAPATGVLVDELIAYGVKDFIIIGGAGGLQPDCPAGAVVVCEKAIRDEGLSHHYLAPGRFATPSPELTGSLHEAIEQAGIVCRVGASWTIDAPYRETAEEARAYQRDGICAVEMEAAGLFAVTSTRGARAAAAFVVMDSLAQLTWEPDFPALEVAATLRRLCEIAVEVLADS